MRFLKFLPALLIVASTSFSSTVDESTKRFIYEITTPGVGRGTGFVINDSLLGYVLVTCKHVVQDKKGNYVDSILVRQNKLLSTGEAISDTNQFVIRLRVDGRLYLAEHPNPNVDLIMIPFLDFNIATPQDQYIVGLRSHFVLSKDLINKLGINEGTDVELIGFSLSSSLSWERAHYHFSRFGKVGLFTTDEFTLVVDSVPRTANYILLDMSTRPGDSGSPIFAHMGENSYLIGFLSARSEVMEFGIGYPVYYLYDLMKIIRDKFSAVLEKQKK